MTVETGTAGMGNLFRVSRIMRGSSEESVVRLCLGKQRQGVLFKMRRNLMQPKGSGRGEYM